MRRLVSAWAWVLVIVTAVCGNGTAYAADEYAYDGVHSSVSFKARHLDISWIHGRFNEVDGKFSLDRQDPSKSTFELTIKVDSVDTANKARDRKYNSRDYERGWNAQVNALRHKLNKEPSTIYAQ